MTLQSPAGETLSIAEYIQLLPWKNSIQTGLPSADSSLTTDTKESTQLKLIYLYIILSQVGDVI